MITHPLSLQRDANANADSVSETTFVDAKRKNTVDGQQFLQANPSGTLDRVCPLTQRPSQELAFMIQDQWQKMAKENQSVSW